MRDEFFDYFGDRQKRYESQISLSTPFVIRFDGKNCTANGIRDLTAPGKGEFAQSLITAAQNLTRKYKGLAYVDLDEVSLIVTEPAIVFNRVGSAKTQDITAVLSQELYVEFDKEYIGYKPVYFAANMFSIPNNKVVSYIQYRTKSCQNVNRVYFSKKNGLNYHRGNVKSDRLKDLLVEYAGYNEAPVYAREGVLVLGRKLCKAFDYTKGVYTPIDINTLDAVETDKTKESPVMLARIKKIEKPEDEFNNGKAFWERKRRDPAPPNSGTDYYDKVLHIKESISQDDIIIPKSSELTQIGEDIDYSSASDTPPLDF